MNKNQPTAKVTNINKQGVRFDPATYMVSRKDCPELYKFLEKVKP